MRWSSASTVIAAAVFAVPAVAQRPADTVGLRDLLSRIGARVEEYYARARTIVCTETVVLQPLAHDLSADGRARRLVYELTVEWEPPSPDRRHTEGTVVRRLVSIDGRPPGPRDKPDCLDPRAVSPEPLSMLLPGRTAEYEFSRGPTGTTSGRPSIRLDYRNVANTPPAIEWSEDCVTVDWRGRSRGRIWIDAATDDVLRIDESLAGPVDIPVPRTRRSASLAMTIDRADSTIEYRPVTFSDPAETWMVPSSIESVTVVRNAGAPRMRTTQTFSNYRRFTTSGRIVR
jgi:hypothetical protein